MKPKINSLKIMLLTMSCLLSFALKAEYNSLHIKVKITTVTGNVFDAYQYIPAYPLNLDSINNIHYSTKMLSLLSQIGDDIMVYYENRLNYIYDDPFQEGLSTALVLVDYREMNVADIYSITLLEWIDSSFTFGISGPTTAADSVWMNIPAVESFTASGILNSYYIYVHEENDVTIAIRNELNVYLDYYLQEDSRLNQIKESSDGNPYYEAVEGLKILEEELERNIGEILQKYGGQKVVIIGFFSC